MAKTNGIKPAWVVLNMDNEIVHDSLGLVPLEFKTEAKAIAKAKELVNRGDDEEFWVYRLSHVVSRPPFDPQVDRVA